MSVSVLNGWIEGTAARAVSAGTGTRLCIVHTTSEDDGGPYTITSVTWGGVALTKVVEQQVGTNSFHNLAAYWYLKEIDFPAAPASATFVVSYSQTLAEDMASVILDGVDQTDPVPFTNSSSAEPYGPDITISIDVTADGYSTLAGTSSSSRTFDSWIEAAEVIEYTVPAHTSAIGAQLETVTETHTAGFTIAASSATRGVTVAIAIKSAGAPPPPTISINRPCCAQLIE